MNDITVQAPEFDQNLLALLFKPADLAAITRYFKTKPDEWASFHERQITGGFVHFINSGSYYCRISRAVAFLKAATACAGTNIPEINEDDVLGFSCAAEKQDIDILLDIKVGTEHFCVVIEAKFEYILTERQLPKYQNYVERLGFKHTNTTLLVIAIDRVDQTNAILAANPSWKSTDWCSFLCALEHFTALDYDCDDYLRFRRSTWRRAYWS